MLVKQSKNKQPIMYKELYQVKPKKPIWKQHMLGLEDKEINYFFIFDYL